MVLIGTNGYWKPSSRLRMIAATPRTTAPMRAVTPSWTVVAGLVLRFLAGAFVLGTLAEARLATVRRRQS